jgi:dihydroorotate dehydrogenase (NAD+) catalytic subunit
MTARVRPRWLPGRVARGGPSGGGTVDLTTRIGSVTLPNPVMTASGTSGQGAGLARHFDLGDVGAAVVTSLHAEPEAGNPPLRAHETVAGSADSVGLRGPGVAGWLADDLPALAATGARVVASIWGRTVAEYERAAALLADAPASVVAVEVNLSCPDTGSGRALFAHSPDATRAVVTAAGSCDRPLWAKLSPNVGDLATVAVAARDAGAEAVTLVDTVLGTAVDHGTGTFRPGAGASAGGLSGPAVHPIAVRAVFDVHRAVPDLPIVGVGGIACGADAAEMMLAGARAVQVGSATFADPRTPGRVLAELRAWGDRRGIARLADVVGAVEDRQWPERARGRGTTDGSD